MYLDRSPLMHTFAADLDKILDAAATLQITASFVQIRENDGGASFWVMTDLKKVSPGTLYTHGRDGD